MDNDKVTLPRDVAEAIEYFREKGHTDAYIVSRSVVGGVGGYELSLVNFDKDVLMSALVNGYTVEQTPEEKVREYFEKCQRNWLLADEQENTDAAEFLNGQLLAISQTLGLLGISIEGINA